MSTKEKENNILLESRGDLFGSRDKNIFHNIDKDWNVFELRVENPTSIMLTSSKYYTQLKMYFTDDIEALERLIEWTKLDGEMTRTIPIPDGKKFYRFALDK